MLGIIGGTGLNTLPDLSEVESLEVDTPWSPTPVVVTRGSYFGSPVVFLPRHGLGHRLPPHRVNYRANIAALQEAGAKRVIGIAAVGGIRADMEPATLVLPHDLIDLTWGRQHSFCDAESDNVMHIEFAPPYDPRLRQDLSAAAQTAEVDVISDGVHAVTQGPRLETAAEIEMLRRMGADIVGMTGMPEAALAKEAELPYACLAMVVNWAAGLGHGGIHDEIAECIDRGRSQVLRVLAAVAG
nr:S-methyl-5'-thioinosine phosphorylase [Oceanococcus sp. HetDA_MAG_MS8]